MGVISNPAVFKDTSIKRSAFIVSTTNKATELQVIHYIKPERTADDFQVMESFLDYGLPIFVFNCEG